MSKLKYFIDKAKQALERIRSEKKPLLERIAKIKDSTNQFPTALHEIESMQRNWSAGRLTDSLEKQLKASTDYAKRSELIACISFVELLLVNGYDIPKNMPSLLKVYDEVSNKAKKENQFYIDSTNSTESMMSYAARKENPLMKN